MEYHKIFKGIFNINNCLHKSLTFNYLLKKFVNFYLHKYLNMKGIDTTLLMIIQILLTRV